MTDAPQSPTDIPLASFTFPVSGALGTKTLLIHKKDCAGTLAVNALTGRIESPLDERPDWAEGLAVALLAEWYGYYARRFGRQYVERVMTVMDAVAFEDLSWSAINAEGDLYEIEADAEHRMNTIAEYAKINRETGDTGKTVAEAEIDIPSRSGQLWSRDEVAALEEAAKHSTGATKTGTKG